jgi:Asp-tRNA(Asn)/Glu-tRNA(Gln) amidotransferase A subunit family amidase
MTETDRVCRRTPRGLLSRVRSAVYSSSMSPTVADRLRAGLRAAEIPATAADIERVLADGSLERVFERLRAMSLVELDDLPDYLGSWVRSASPVAPVGEAGGAATTPVAKDSRHADLPFSIAELAPLLRRRDVSPVELVQRALGRIEERDGDLNAFQLVLRDRSLEAARRAEAEIAGGAYRGPLHGVPVAIKDLFALRGTPTTAGSRILGEDVASVDSAAATRLEAAGVVIVGKTRLPEFAFWPGSANPHYGDTKNPHDLTRDAGGSSSGSAVAVAVGMACAALGSDTGGSIRIPAALCGLVGLKPTFGRISLHGCVPLAWSLDHAGPLTSSVHDADIMLAALSGPDLRDPRTRDSAEWSAFMDLDGGVRGLRVGVLDDDGSQRELGGDEALLQWGQANLALERAGATLVPVDLPEMSALRIANLIILSVEAASYHAPTLRSRYAEYGELCRLRLLGGFAFGASDLVQVQRFRGQVRRKWSDTLSSIHVLSTPSQPDVAPPLGEPASTRFTGPFNALGWPAVSVPYGLGSGGLPLATQLVGKPWLEATMLRAARVVELAGEHAEG